MIKKIILNVFVFFLSIYLAFSAFILVRIITNDIILNSYKAYSFAKIKGNVVVDKVENVYDKGKIWFQKLKNKEEAKKIEEEYKKEQEEKQEKLEELKKELEFNQKVLGGLPYVLALIIFLFTYTKVLKQIEDILEKIS